MAKFAIKWSAHQAATQDIFDPYAQHKQQSMRRYNNELYTVKFFEYVNKKYWHFYTDLDKKYLNFYADLDKTCIPWLHIQWMNAYIYAFHIINYLGFGLLSIEACGTATD